MAEIHNIALGAENLALHFDGRTLLDGFSLSVSTGQKVLMTGPSGCGKSTILKCFLGLAVPQGGEVTVCGRTLNPSTVWTLRKSIAYVTQEPDLGRATVRKAVEKPFNYRANAHIRGNLSKLGELMEMFSLGPGLLDKNTSKLSGGEKQRFALIMAIMLDRPVMLLDEPTSALDAATRRKLAQYLQSRTDLTALIVAHDTDAFSFADRVVTLEPHSEDDAR